MDAYDDWLEKSRKTFQSFINELQLEDPLYQRFEQDGVTPVTYARGTKRLNYIPLESTILPAIKKIGTSEEQKLYLTVIYDYPVVIFYIG